MTIKLCQMTGCDKDLYAKGMCKMHYTRYRRIHFTETCTAGECDRPVEAQGVCSMHYQEKRRRIKGMKPMFKTVLIQGEKKQKLYVSKQRLPRQEEG